MTFGTRCRLAVLVSLALATPAAAQGFRAVEPFTVDGALDLIIVPEGWDGGGLFIYAHGYTADQRTIVPYPADITPDNLATKLTGGDQVLQIPLNLGYAAATTTYRSAGWAVADAVQDIENVRRHFIATYGQPSHSYIWGHSEGGMVTQAVLELADPPYDGALPFCAPGAGARRNFNAAFDLRAVYEYVCRDVPEARFTCHVCSGKKARCLVDADCPAGQTCGAAERPPRPADGLTRACADFLLGSPQHVNEQPRFDDFVGRSLAACFGTGGTPTAEQAARQDLFMRVTRLPESYIATDMFFASVGIAEVFHRRTHRRHPWGNAGVRYAAPQLTAAEQEALDRAIVRTRADSSAVRYMRRWFEPRGETKSKVLTLHALDDGLVLPENEEKYREAFQAAGTLDQLVQLYTPTGGHCGFSGAEHLAAFLALTSWVEQGRKPTAGNVQGTCRVFTPIAGGPCRITDASLGEWGERVVERREAGAPLRSLVCDGDAVDCPARSSCGADNHCR
jgi:hypothetical protein